MMKNLLNILSFLALGLFFPITVPAQRLGPLPQAEEIVTGRLGNGVRYYLVSNPSYKGMVDIALVQKTGRSDEPYDLRGETVVRSRAALTDLPHFEGISPFNYLSGKSLWPREEGYTRVTDQATVFRFDNLVRSRKGAIVDSTLLLVFDIIGRDYGAMSKSYSTDNQAVIVSGDIQPQEVLGKMNMLSLFVTSRPAGEKTPDYTWHDLMTPDVRVAEGRPAVRVQYRFPRTPADRMNTAVPLVSYRYAETLRLVLERRLDQALRDRNIPYAGIRADYSGSLSQGGDETFSITLETRPADQAAALCVLSGILADLDSNGLGIDEYRDVEGALSDEIYERYGSSHTENSRYMDRCIAAFLYGSSLASDRTSLDFFTGRRMEEATAVRLFNTFVSALLDRSRNLTLEWRGDGMTEEALRKTFQDAWVPAATAIPASRADTLGLRKGFSKTKLSNTLADPLFGGEIWTFSNGIKVIYKQVPRSGFFRWNWELKGGYSSLPGISDGEGAYLSDLLYLSRVAGLPPERFFRMLSSNGITLHTDITFSETTLSGIAPDAKLPLLLKSLAALGEDRHADAKAYAYYRDCMTQRMGGRSVDAVLDSLLHESMTYTPYRRTLTLRDDLSKRAERFFNNTFSKMNDGVLILVGGMDKAQVAKTLSLYLGAFRTEKASSIRSRVRHGLREGRHTYRTRAEFPYLAVAMSAPINYTAENFMAAHIAAFTMQEHVSAAAAPAGWHTRADWTVRMFPDESLDMTLYLERAAEDGLPASMVREDSTDVVLARVRAAIDALGARGLTDTELAVGRSVVANYYASWSSDPAAIMRLLVLRYSYGKDLVTGADSKMASVGSAAVNPILSRLAAGGIGEYVAVRAHVPPVQEPVLVSPRLYIPPMTWVKGAYPFDGSTLPPAPVSLDSLKGLPVLDFGEDSLHRVWRDSVVLGRAIRRVEESSKTMIDSILDGE